MRANPAVTICCIRTTWAAAGGLFLLGSGFLSGCGGPAPEPAPQAAATTVQTAAEPPAVTEPVSATTPTTATPTPSESEEAKGTKWLGKIPYDVFYDRPVEVVGTVPRLGEQPVAVARVESVPATSIAEQPVDQPSAATGSEMSWSTVIGGDVLDEEAKIIRTRLTGNLQTVATYNNSRDALAVDTLVLATLAGIAERTDGDVRWKDRAATIRQLAYDVWSEVGSSGGKAFRSTLDPFETLRTAMDGGRVEVDASEREPFGDYADRSALMQRVEQTSNWLRNEIPSADKLKQNSREVIREASVLAALGQVIQTENYEYADEAEYRGSAGEFVAAALAVREAAEAGNFDDYQAARNRLSATCANCHGRYLTGGSGL